MISTLLSRSASFLTWVYLGACTAFASCYLGAYTAFASYLAGLPWLIFYFLCLAVLPRPAAPGGSTTTNLLLLMPGGSTPNNLLILVPAVSTPTNCTWRFFLTSSSFCAWRFCPNQLHLAVLFLPALILVIGSSHPTSSSFFVPSGSTSPSVLLAVLPDQFFANLVGQTYPD